MFSPRHDVGRQDGGVQLDPEMAVDEWNGDVTGEIGCRVVAAARRGSRSRENSVHLEPEAAFVT